MRIVSSGGGGKKVRESATEGKEMYIPYGDTGE